MPGLRKGHDKHGDRGDGGDAGDATEIVTTSTLEFALDPPTLTTSGNTCSVTGLEPGQEYSSSTEYRPDVPGSGVNSGGTVNEDAPGSYSWSFILKSGATPGDCKTWLHPAGTPFATEPSAGPDGNPLQWSFRYDGE